MRAPTNAPPVEREAFELVERRANRREMVYAERSAPRDAQHQHRRVSNAPAEGRRMAIIDQTERAAP